MKKLILLVTAILLATSFNINTPIAKAAFSNMVANPSVETAILGSPTGWTNSQWGTMTSAYEYKTGSAPNGTHYLSVNVSSYTDGDAKWLFDPITVKPNTQYVFSDYSSSNVSGEVVIQYTDTTDAVSHSWLGTVTPSTSWKQNYFSFKTPANVSKLTVLHLINRVGKLDTDNYYITEVPPVTGTIPNPDLETKNPAMTSMPLGWNKGNYGSNSPTYTYMNKFGHNNSKGAVGITMKNYVDGDAKWYYDAQPVTPNQTYQYNAYYHSDVPVRVTAMINKTNGTTIYLPLKVAETTGPLKWTKYSDLIVMPADVATATIFFMIAANGTIWTDDYSMAPYVPTGFSQGMVTISFDDGWESNYTTALPKMQAMGFKSTQYFATTYLENATPADILNVQQFVTAGHEIGSHSVTHPDLTTVSDATLQYELTHSQQYLSTTFNTPITSFATPFGAYNAKVTNTIKQYYASDRSVDMGYNYNSKEDFNVNNIRAQSLINTTTDAQVQAWVDYARIHKVWLVLVYHVIDTDTSDMYSNTPAQFQSHLNIIKNSGLPVRTTSQAIAELQGQVR